LVYGICLTVLIVAVGVCFALSCISIYRSGNSPFTRESIGAHFDRIAIPVYLCIAGVIGGWVLSWALPLEGGRVKPRREAGVTLDRLSAKLNLSACEASVQTAIRRERRFRRGTAVTVGILSVLTLLPALVWCVNPAHFSIGELNRDIMAASALVIPCAAVALGLWVAAVLLRGASVARETAAVKAALASGQGKADTQETVLSHKKKLTSDPRCVWGVRGVILVLGAVFIVLGILNGGMADVLGKAIRICTECIGLG
jgi:small-conductance mechanosensitive channel